MKQATRTTRLNLTGPHLIDLPANQQHHSSHCRAERIRGIYAARDAGGPGPGPARTGTDYRTSPGR